MTMRNNDYQHIFQISPAALIILDRQGLVVEGNIAAATIFIASFKTRLVVPGTHFSTLVALNDQQSIEKLVKDATQDQAIRINVKNQAGDSLSIDLIALGADQASQVLATIVLDNVDEQTMFDEDSLSDRSASAPLVFEKVPELVAYIGNAGIGMISYEADGTIIWSNQVFATMVACDDKNKLIGQSTKELVAEEYAEQEAGIRQHFSPVLNTKPEAVKTRTMDGRELWIDILLSKAHGHPSYGF